MSNPVIDAMLARRSHRAYKSEQITEEELSLILKAGLAAPSAMNRMPYHISVVQDAPTLRAFAACCRRHAMEKEAGQRSPRFEDADFDVFYHAPTVLFISCDDSFFAPIDCGILAQNMALAAESLKLGSVHVGMAREAFQQEDKALWEKALRFPEGYRFALALAVGHPRDSKEAHDIRDGVVTRVTPDQSQIKRM